MASKFTITAELSLQTKNLNQVVRNLQSQFNNANLNIKIKDLAQAQSHIQKISSSSRQASKDVGVLGNSMEQAFKRFTVITAVTGTLIAFTRAIKNSISEAITFEREVVKIAQATGQTVSQLKGLTREIDSVSTTFGVASEELILAARSLTQAGFAADKVAGSLKVLAQTELAATFDSIQDTTEGAIALLNQFGRQAQRTGSEVKFLEQSFSAINQVSKEFAVESSDLVTAIRTTGAAFESAGGDLNELLALFTSVRSTTRESAESIATGFRTIFTRVQRVDTINALRSLGIELQDVEGKFIGPMEAVKRLSVALNTIDPRDFRFNLVVEELGGFRQVSKVIPLIQQFAVAQKALNVAQNSSGSLAKDAQTAQQALAVQIAKTREEFQRFMREMVASDTFQSTVRTALDLANAFIKIADSVKPLIPLIATFGALKAGAALVPALKSFAGSGKRGGIPIGFATGGLVPGSGNGDTVPAMLTPGEFVIRKSSVNKIGASNLSRINKYADGGRVTLIPKANRYGIFALEPEGEDDKDNYSTGVKVKNKDVTEQLRNKFNLPKDSEVAIGGFLKSFHIGNDAQNNVRQTFKDSTEKSFSRMITDVSNDVSKKVGSKPVDIESSSLKSAITSLFNQDSKSARSAIEGYILEGVSSAISGAELAGGQERWDFPNPAASANGLAKLFGKEQEIAALNKGDVKRTDNSEARSDVRSNKLARTLLENPEELAEIVGDKAYTPKKIKSSEGTLGGIVDRLASKYEGVKFEDGSVNGAKISRSTISNIIQQIPGMRTKVGVNDPVDEKLVEFIENNIGKIRKKHLGGAIHKFASGGFASGTDTVPAMLTPGEFVVNKKSAQRIGYGNLNRMNKVGKYANGGVVQYLANGGNVGKAGTKFDPDAQRLQASMFLGQFRGTLNSYQIKQLKDVINGMINAGLDAEKAMIQMAKDIKIAQQNPKMLQEYFATPEDVKSRGSKYRRIAREETPEVENLKKGLKLSGDKLLIFGSMASSVIGQMGALDQKTADIVSSAASTFSILKGIGSQLTGLAGQLGASDKWISRMDSVVTGFASAQAIAATRATMFGQAAEDASKKIDLIAEAVKNGAKINEKEITQAFVDQLQNAELEKASRSSTRSAASTGIATGLSFVINKVLSSNAKTKNFAGPASQAAFGLTAIIEPVLFKLQKSFGFFDEDLKKAGDEADKLAKSFVSSVRANREFEKVSQKLDELSTVQISKQVESLSLAYAEQQKVLASFTPERLQEGGEALQKQFNFIAEEARKTGDALSKLSGEAGARVIKKVGQAAQGGFILDPIEEIREAFKAESKRINAESEAAIEKAGGNKPLINEIQKRTSEQLALAQMNLVSETQKAQKQSLEMQASQKIEISIRNDLIGSMQRQLAIGAASERMTYHLENIGKDLNQIDALYSGNLSGMKSRFNSEAISMNSPEPRVLAAALDPVRKLGPVGQELVSRFTDLSKILPTLEGRLVEISNAADSGSNFDVGKWVSETFQVGPNSSAAKALTNIISNTLAPKTGSGNSAEKVSLRNPEVRGRIFSEFKALSDQAKDQILPIIKNLEMAEGASRNLAQKLSESAQRQIELSGQTIDSLSKYADASAKARGKELSLNEKNLLRAMKQQSLAGRSFNSVGEVGTRLVQIQEELKKVDFSKAGDARRAATLSLEQNRLKKSLEGLANQSDRTADVMAEIEKFRKQRESLADAGKEFVTGTSEERADFTKNIQAAMTVAATGTFDSIPEEMRKGASAVFDRFADIPGFKEAQNRAIAGDLYKAGAPAAAQMVLSQTSTPEQKLIGELKSITAQEIAAQAQLSQIERQYQTELSNNLDQYSDQIGGYTVQLENVIKEYMIREKKGLPPALPQGRILAQIDPENIVQINQTANAIGKANEGVAVQIGIAEANIKKLNQSIENITKPPEKPEAGFVSAIVNWFGRMMGGPQSRAGGGSIFKRRGTDTVPAMLTPGEYVIKKSTVDKMGKSTLDAINAGYFSRGGLARRRRAAMMAQQMPVEQPMQQAPQLAPNQRVAESYSGLSRVVTDVRGVDRKAARLRRESPEYAAAYAQSTSGISKELSDKFYSEYNQGQTSRPSGYSQTNQFYSYRPVNQPRQMSEIEKRNRQEIARNRNSQTYESPQDAANRAYSESSFSKYGDYASYAPVVGGIAGLMKAIPDVYYGQKTFIEAAGSTGMGFLGGKGIARGFKSLKGAITAGKSANAAGKSASAVKSASSYIKANQTAAGLKYKGSVPSQMSPAVKMNRPSYPTEGLDELVKNGQRGSHKLVTPNHRPKQWYASGGLVPAMLTPGEYVMNSSAVSKYGSGFMNHLNSGGLVKYLRRGGSTGGAQQTSRSVQRTGITEYLANKQQSQQAVWDNKFQQQAQMNPFFTQMGGNQMYGMGGGGGSPQLGGMEEFGSFVNQFKEAAGGMTMSHSLTVDGQLNIAGIDGNAIAAQISQALGQYVGNLVQQHLNKQNRRPGT